MAYANAFRTSGTCAKSFAKLAYSVTALGLVLAAPGAAFAQSAEEDADTEVTSADAPEDDSSLLNVIVVTAQKGREGEAVQDIPVAITAFSGAQLEALNFRTVDDLTIATPNVTLDRNGNSRTHANFTIRGLGANSSIVTIEPAVGLFVNGVYQGIPAGTVVDNFDVQNVQILRGPQGTLFGRNVTGGAVLIETKRPSGDTGGELQASIETGPEYSIAGAFETSIVPDAVDFRIAGYYRKDEGWFTNDFDGSKFGKLETFFVRPTIVLSPNGPVRQTFIGEYGEANGDGPAEQGLNLIGEDDGFKLVMDNPGWSKPRWYSVTSETEIDTAFGDGVVTNVFGYRNYESDGSSDIDATGLPLFHSNGYVKQDQISNELRYAGRFGNLDLTVGTFMFFQDIFLVEDRDPFVGGAQGGGGTLDHSSYAAFAQGTYHLTDQLSLTAGLRYSYEEKTARVVRRQRRGCIVETRECDLSLAEINDSDSWDSLSPRVGIDFQPNSDMLFYASYSEATRSGGYNLRLASPLDAGIFDQENVKAYEAGAKLDLFDRSVRANLAVFHMQFDNLQRTVNQTINGSNIVQTLTNGANAKSTGFESEFIIAPVDGIEILANLAYTDMEYTEVFFDLNGDNVVNDVDLALRTPRVSKWSYGGGIVGRTPIGQGELRGQVVYAYRSDQAADDANNLFYPSRNDLRANIAYTFPGDQIELSIYGRNLLNEVPDSGAKLIVPAFPSGGFRAIDEGRTIGGQIKYRF